ncbi:hypothetical protein Tcan_08836 [Toxocara canis]|uniref:Pyroglutamyl-peptidase 1 n=1 Tax=Toxocara canis TaxID=6265 RepID=A0A0B2US36_TOXCA|nr:hypothetical protein Tcan_08836 [Toxocara canis]
MRQARCLAKIGDRGIDGAVLAVGSTRILTVQLVIHVGAHPDPRTIKITKFSFGRGYCLLDVECQVPCGNTCPCGVETTERPQSVLVSDFDCNEIASSVSQFFDSNCIKIEPSNDPGSLLDEHELGRSEDEGGLYTKDGTDTQSNKLVIHVGAHPDPRTIKIEQQSFGRGYCLLDVECQVPCGNTCPCGVETTERPQSVLVSDFDCNEIASSVSQFFDSNCIKIEPSNDPGRVVFSTRTLSIDNGQVPCGNTCPCGVETTERPQSVLVSDFDCNEIASSVSQFFDSNCIKIEPSNDPGRYLCAYSYFISLSHDKRKSLFVHVPGFNEDITEQLVATALKRIINECFKQLNRS